MWAILFQERNLKDRGQSLFPLKFFKIRAFRRLAHAAGKGACEVGGVFDADALAAEGLGDVRVVGFGQVANRLR